MSLQITSQRIRFTVDASKWVQSSTDIFLGAPITLASGADLQIENIFSFGTLSDAPSTVIDLVPFSQIIYSLQDSNSAHNAEIFWSVVVPANQFDNTVTAAQWSAATSGATKQQTLVRIPSGTNNIQPPSQGESMWLCLYGVTSGATKAWAINTAFALGDIVIDTNGNPQRVTSAGTSGGSAPTWATVVSTTTTDNSVTWTMIAVTGQKVPLGAFAINLYDTGIPISFGVMYILCSDNLVRRVSAVQDASSNWVLDVEQTGLSQNGQSLPYVVDTAGAYHRISLVQDAGGIWTIAIT